MERGGSSNPTRGINIQGGGTATNTAHPQQSFKREPDQYMPIANVIRIMRRVLPDQAKISDDAKETIQECVSEFIGFVTSEANKRCHREYRKTVTPDDVLSAMGSLGFGAYVGPLAIFLDRHRAQDPDRGPSQQHALLYAARGARSTAPDPAGQLQVPAADRDSYGGWGSPEMGSGYFVGGGEGSLGRFEQQ